jgi:thiol:disulfide interchange protein DsbD
MKFLNCSMLRKPSPAPRSLNRIAKAVLLAGLSPGIVAPCFAQGPNVLSIVPPEKLTAKAGSTAQARLTVHIQPGYHANSNTPSDEYLIPMRLTWPTGPLETAEVIYPKPEMEKYSFSDKPLSVYTGGFELVTRFKVPPAAAPGQLVLAGKLRYQACNDRMCLAPKTIEVSLPVEVVK